MQSYELRDRRASATPAGTSAGPHYYGEPDPSLDTKGAPPTTVRDVDFQGRKGSDAGAPVVGEVNDLKRNLSGRHMQMIAIGGAIGAGLFVGTGGALNTGGPASLVICFIIIGVMMLMMMQALGELAVLYPVNGAFYTYIVRFIDPSLGFALGWEYAIQWLTILPFEITAASLTIKFWNDTINVGVWIAVFLTVLSIIQIFGVRGYGEVEFVLSMVKVAACLGFILFGIIDVCGGISTDDRGYIGTRYYHAPYEAFKNGFKGFCSVFVTASFAFGGTELTGLAAAEAADPVRQLPKATRQVFWRISFFYVLNLAMLGLMVAGNDDRLLNASNSNTKDSPFVIAITNAGVKGLPSVFNAVITISVISVANSATFASTRTLQALALRGMAPKFLAYVDKKGRPIPTIILQLLFGLLAFVNEAPAGSTVFNWLLALSGLANFFVYGAICVSHIRFRMAWARQGHTLDELPYKASFGVYGSYLGAGLNLLCLIAQFYTAAFPIGGGATASGFFQSYLAAPLAIGLYIIWKVISWFKFPAHRPLWVSIDKIDIYTGMRMDARTGSVVQLEDDEKLKYKGPMGKVKQVLGWFF